MMNSLTTYKRPSDSIELTEETIKSHLDAFEKIDRESLIESVDNAIKSDEMLLGEFKKIVPLPLIFLSIIVNIEGLYENILEESNAEEKEAFVSAKTFFQKHLPELHKNQKAKSAFFEELEAQRSPLKDSINSIKGINYRSNYLGSSPELKPTIHLGFIGKNSELLLDVSADWNDLVLVTKSLIKALHSEMERSLPLLELKQISVPFKEKIAKNLIDIQETIDQVTEMASTYEINLN